MGYIVRSHTRATRKRRSQSVYPSWIAHSPVARHKMEGFVPGKFNQRSDFTHNTLKNIIKQAIEERILYNERYVVHYRPESKPRQEVSHLERTLHLDMVCCHRNQLIDRTKNVYCLKNSNNKDQGFIFNSSLSRQNFKIYEINSIYKSFNVDCYLVSIIFSLLHYYKSPVS